MCSRLAETYVLDSSPSTCNLEHSGTQPTSIGQQSTHGPLDRKMPTFVTMGFWAICYEALVWQSLTKTTGLARPYTNSFLRMHTLNWYLCGLEFPVFSTFLCALLKLGRLVAWKHAKKTNGQDSPVEMRQHVHIRISVFGYYLQVSAIFKYQPHYYWITFDGLTNLIKQQLHILVLFLYL